ncbi:nuclear transport factor 2 family protein [Undibacterium terreum]|uniref:DUF4440 domain-containing protein n=1 Tax=Undibacterium terreum TaxID=1224302 RepID=A0A916U6J3_9BURK|nr:nuclear transport factor 2 family protein [Undibacterium terreum]GGC60979.1 hypothetical protein GCM10011396_04910 [Undibacterium terreum]
MRQRPLLLIAAACFFTANLAFGSASAFAAASVADAVNSANVANLGVAAVQQLAAAQKNFDPVAMDAILAADYVEISPIGEVDARAKVLTFYGPEQKARAAQAPVQVMELDQISARTYGDSTIIVVARWPSKFTDKEGKTTERALRVVYVVCKIADKWLVSSAQYTGIRQ